MIAITAPNPASAQPLYRQLYLSIREKIESGEIENGTRLPPTRELAGSLGLNRTTISAAYELLESEGFVRGHVGRGSFVSRPGSSLISFSSSRPSELLFPLAEFRATCTEVIQSEDAQTILQLGSPSGYGPLRRYLLEQARIEGTAGETDDILITSGCQQAYDLLQRVLVANGETVLVEDPVIPGLRNVFQRTAGRLVGIPVGTAGIDLDALQQSIRRERPRLVVVTPNFQNPTGATMPLAHREKLLAIIRDSGTLLVESDIYGALRYAGDPLPTLKQLDPNTILLRSFSKLAFPGLRVGWVIAPRPIVERLTEAKQWSDLHTDQLSQAVLLRFAQSGRLEEHRRHMLAAGRDRLQSAIAACEKHLPPGSTFTRPAGGMNLWVRLPEPLDAGELLAAAEREGVTYLPGKFFGVSKVDPGGMRISFAGLAPERIETGIAVLGRVFRAALERAREYSRLESVPAMV
jgi:DNA-binding transcriptional MocR family regulator